MNDFLFSVIVVFVACMFLGLLTLPTILGKKKKQDK